MVRQTGVLSNSCDQGNLAKSFVASSSKASTSDQVNGLDEVLDALVELDEHLTHAGVRFEELELRR